MKKLKIRVDNLNNKTENMKRLKDKQTSLETKINRRTVETAISDKERKVPSERMKKSWGVYTGN